MSAAAVHEHSTECKHDHIVDPVTSATEALAALPTQTAPGVKYESANKKAEDFRNYENSARQATVEKFYHDQHVHQTYETVQNLNKKYLTFDRKKMGIWEALEYLDTFVDDSDPDTSLSQLQHALQTAEAIRSKYPGEEYDWFPLVGLIHDLGKILCFNYGEPQYFAVGDTFPVGCQFSEKNIFHKYFAENPDNTHPIYSTHFGVYQPNCGLRNITMSWGHDEYLYRLCVHNGSTLPQQALYAIRYHSFYPWHKDGAYSHLTDAVDAAMLPWVKELNSFDLYSKSDTMPDPKQLKEFYCKLIDKYFPKKILDW